MLALPGGRIQSDKGDMGFAAGSSGIVNVTSGTWANTQAIFVGVNGSGTFSATGGGSVSSAWGQLDLNAGSAGAATLDNASWSTPAASPATSRATAAS